MLQNSIHVLKCRNSNTYVGSGNTVFIFNTKFLAWNIKNRINRNQSVTFIQDDDTTNKFVLMADARIPDPPIDIVVEEEEKNKVIASLAGYDMNAVIVDSMIVKTDPNHHNRDVQKWRNAHGIRSSNNDSDVVTLVGSHKITPYNPNLETKRRLLRIMFNEPSYINYGIIEDEWEPSA